MSLGSLVSVSYTHLDVYKRQGLKKYRKPFDMAFMYIVWYGLVRFIMEPLRNPMFRMGAGGKWSEYKDVYKRQHADDVGRLITSLQAIVANGDTVIVIEHNLDIIKVADYIIDLGPGGGNYGGRVVASGTPRCV